MRRRDALTLTLAALGGQCKFALGRTSIPAPLPELCRRAAIVAVVEDILSREIATPLGDCGSRTEARIVRVIAGLQNRDRLAWRGISVFMQAPSYVILASIYPLASQFADRLEDAPRATNQEKAFGEQLLKSCAPLHSDFVVNQAFPVVNDPSGSYVLMGRDDEDIADFREHIDLRKFRRRAQGLALELAEFQVLVKRFRGE